MSTRPNKASTVSGPLEQKWEPTIQILDARWEGRMGWFSNCRVISLWFERRNLLANSHRESSALIQRGEVSSPLLIRLITAVNA